jgi:hypothetical protein
VSTPTKEHLIEQAIASYEAKMNLVKLNEKKTAAAKYQDMVKEETPPVSVAPRGRRRSSKK